MNCIAYPVCVFFQLISDYITMFGPVKINMYSFVADSIERQEAIAISEIRQCWSCNFCTLASKKERSRNDHLQPNISVGQNTLHIRAHIDGAKMCLMVKTDMWIVDAIILKICTKTEREATSSQLSCSKSSRRWERHTKWAPAQHPLSLSRTLSLLLPLLPSPLSLLSSLLSPRPLHHPLTSSPSSPALLLSSSRPPHSSARASAGKGKRPLRVECAVC